MANDIDILMDLDPLELSKIDGALDAIIAYHRNRRANLIEAPSKPKRGAAMTEAKPKINLEELMNSKPKAAPTTSGSFRR